MSRHQQSDLGLKPDPPLLRAYDIVSILGLSADSTLLNGAEVSEETLPQIDSSDFRAYIFPGDSRTYSADGLQDLDPIHLATFPLQAEHRPQPDQRTVHDKAEAQQTPTTTVNVQISDPWWKDKEIAALLEGWSRHETFPYIVKHRLPNRSAPACQSKIRRLKELGVIQYDAAREMYMWNGKDVKKKGHCVPPNSQKYKVEGGKWQVFSPCYSYGQR